jgi:hypothetical protein
MDIYIDEYLYYLQGWKKQIPHGLKPVWNDKGNEDSGTSKDVP